MDNTSHLELPNIEMYLLVKDMQDYSFHSYIQIPEICYYFFVLGDISSDQHDWT